MFNPWNDTMDRIGAWATTLSEIPDNPSDANRLLRLAKWAVVMVASFSLCVLVGVLRGD